MEIKIYHSDYFNNCLSILKSNMPEYIDPSEQILFETFLSKIPSTYFVLFKKHFYQKYHQLILFYLKINLSLRVVDIA